ncbi:arylsulfatase [Streptococcus pneumoniae]|nr:arylsulfatase [Streptococcus pneumoniae]VND17965.1 arylsulfatase [Streptococcus pneumoniae]VSU66550.1 arylsulfatase [Streptococcus pneumoniae]
MVQTKQPNIILIVVDQMRADVLSLNSKDKLVSTPTLDMMASVGYNFENAYSPVPSCVPARAALLTGLDQDKSGRVGYQDEVPWNFTNTLPKVFKDMGYQTECIGKMHVFLPDRDLGLIMSYFTMGIYMLIESMIRLMEVNLIMLVTI